MGSMVGKRKWDIPRLNLGLDLFIDRLNHGYPILSYPLNYFIAHRRWDSTIIIQGQIIISGL